MRLFSPTAARATALGVVPLIALCVDALSQPIPAPETAPVQAGRESFDQWSALTDQYQAAIQQEESRSGPHSRALIDSLMSLGLAHQEYGRHDLAVETIDRALQVKRINDGFHTLEQVPMLRQLMAIELASGYSGSAVALEDRMVELARRNRGDLRSVPIFHEAADRQLAMYERYLEQGFPPQFSVTSNVLRSRGSTRGRASFGLRQAQRNYASAIRSILRNEDYTHEDLPELERKLIRTHYLDMTDGNRSYDRSGRSYYQARESYRRQVVYSTARSGTVLAFAKALVELADWDLLFSRNGKALEQYEEAYRLLIEEGVPEAAIREIFDRDTPVRLPTFLPNPFVSEAPPEASAHIDVAFELSRFGVGRKIKIVAASDNATNAAERDLVRIISGNRFRPRLHNGDASDAPRYYVRYYVSP